MEAQVSKSDLGKALRAATRAISRKPDPNTEGVYIEARPMAFEMRATSGTLDVVATLPAQVAECGSAVVSPKSLGESLKGAQTKIANISLNGQASVNGRDVSLLPIREYHMPFAPHHEAKPLLDCGARELASAIESVAYAADEELRVIFQSVFLRKSGNTMTVVGLNNYRMAIASFEVDNGQDFEYLVPAESALSAVKALDGMERCIIEIERNNSDYLSFFASGAGYTVATTMRVTKERFPSFEHLVPTEFETTWTLDPSELLVCAKEAVKKGRGEFLPLRIDLKDGQMVSDVHVEGIEIVRAPSNKTKSGTAIERKKTEETVKIVGRVEGRSRRIGISPDFLAGALSHVTGQVTINLSRYTAVIKPTNGDCVTHVIMLVYLGEAIVR